jgi:Na+-driven multidrug efflux pump
VGVPRAGRETLAPARVVRRDSTDGIHVILGRALVTFVILPGLISVAFYKRKPTAVQIGLGLVATIVLSAALGYISPGGPLGVVGSVVVAIAGGVVLYLAILWYLVYVYQPKHAPSSSQIPPAIPP